MEGNLKKIAVLMTCHNRMEKTLHCLDALCKAFLPKDFIIKVYLVDDGSTDGTGVEVKRNFPQVEVINGNGNLYWNRGMNLAWQIAVQTSDYEYFLWLNDDVELNYNSIDLLIGDVKRVGGNNSIIAGSCQSAEGFVTYTGYNNLTKKIKLIPNGEIQQCEYFNGNVVLIPKAVFNKVGFLDPQYHHGQGDFDYGLRAAKLGISSFISSGFAGICEPNAALPVWCNPHYSLLKRLKHFISPLGGRPKTTFLFQKKYMGFVPAAFHYITIHLRLLFPQAWTIR